MQELQTNKPMEYTENLHHTTHLAPYEPIVFNDNYSFYFNSLSSVQDVLKESPKVMSQRFQDGLNFFEFCSMMHPKISICIIFKTQDCTTYSKWQKVQLSASQMTTLCKYFLSFCFIFHKLHNKLSLTLQRIF